MRSCWSCRAAASVCCDGDAGRLAQAERPRDGGQHQLGIAHGGQGDEGDAVRVVRLQLGGDLQGEARLAHAAGTGQGEQGDSLLLPQARAATAISRSPAEEGRARVGERGHDGTCHAGHPWYESSRKRG